MTSAPLTAEMQTAAVSASTVGCAPRPTRRYSSSLRPSSEGSATGARTCAARTDRAETTFLAKTISSSSLKESQICEIHAT